MRKRVSELDREECKKLLKKQLPILAILILILEKQKRRNFFLAQTKVQSTPFQETINSTILRLNRLEVRDKNSLSLFRLRLKSNQGRRVSCKIRKVDRSRRIGQTIRMKKGTCKLESLMKLRIRSKGEMWVINNNI